MCFSCSWNIIFLYLSTLSDNNTFGNFLWLENRSCFQQRCRWMPKSCIIMRRRNKLPLPASTTSSTFTPSSWARYPREVNMVNPAKNEVRQFPSDTTNESLKQSMKELKNLLYFFAAYEPRFLINLHKISDNYGLNCWTQIKGICPRSMSR